MLQREVKFCEVSTPGLGRFRWGVPLVALEAAMRGLEEELSRDVEDILDVIFRDFCIGK